MQNICDGLWQLWHLAWSVTVTKIFPSPGQMSLLPVLTFLQHQTSFLLDHDYRWMSYHGWGSHYPTITLINSHMISYRTQVTDKVRKYLHSGWIALFCQSSLENKEESFNRLCVLWSGNKVLSRQFLYCNSSLSYLLPFFRALQVLEKKLLRNKIQLLLQYSLWVHRTHISIKYGN